MPRGESPNKTHDHFMIEARKFRVAFAKQGTNAISNGSIIQALDLESARKIAKTMASPREEVVFVKQCH